MNYIELYITVAEGEAADLLVARLSDFPFDGFEQQRECLKAYITEDEFEKYRDGIEDLLQKSGVAWESSVMENINWNREWESNFEPVDVDGKCYIRAPFHEPAPAGYLAEIVIMPKMSFGTGHHATTWLMVDRIMDHDFSGLRGLDIGSGTGVLSIAAVLRGAEHMDAVDIDEWAYGNCIENIADNGAGDKITPLLGDMSAVAGNRYDFILANINRNILLEDMDKYVSVLVGSGLLLMSGILRDDIPDITAKAEALGLTVGNISIRNGWAAVECRQ